MAAGSVFAIPTQVYGHAKAARATASSVKLPNLGLLLAGDVPNVDSPIISCRRKIGAVLAQGQRPDLARLR